MITRFEKFSFAISEISRYWHKIASDEMDKYGLKGPYAVYFTAMSRYPEGITAAQLCEICGRDKSDVSRAITLMEKKGLVSKISVSQTLYRARLVLTQEGKTAAQQINERARMAVEFGGKGISEENRKIFYESLEKIANNLQAISEDGLPG